MKLKTLFISICVLTIIGIALAQHLGQFHIRPSSDGTEVFKVMDKDGNPIMSVNTSTDGATVNGTLTASGNASLGGTLTQTGAATFSNILDLSATLVCDTNSFAGVTFAKRRYSFT